MTLMGSSFFILGLVVASATAQGETTTMTLSTVPMKMNNEMTINNATTVNANLSRDITNTTTNINHTTTQTSAINVTSTPSTTSGMNITNATSTIMPSTTMQKGGVTKDGKAPTVKPISPSRTTSASTTKSNTKDKETTDNRRNAGSNSTGIIIFFVIILIACGLGIGWYITRKRGNRRYSVDFTPSPDGANIPLSTVEPELPVDTVPQNGLQTSENTEATKKESQEPEAKPEVQEEQKHETEADKSVVDPGAESAAPAPSPDSSGDKPKEDVVEQSPPAPVEPSTEEKTDDEGVVSNKTSVESLKETNENNSNNTDFSQERDLESSYTFWDIPLNCPV
ncbi:endochitinase 2 [Toxotes jaculatrix]|uniref:endochitinase 2 n=1 Tax=Toxotes jaculatrix TaxID=941984 RepID=UPI001B3A8C8E|nr:endochitinase 2 [Toxotes jaculatrix]